MTGAGVGLTGAGAGFAGAGATRIGAGVKCGALKCGATLIAEKIKAEIILLHQVDKEAWLASSQKCKGPFPRIQSPWRSLAGFEA